MTPRSSTFVCRTLARRVARLPGDAGGATALEYVAILGLVAMASVAAVKGFNRQVGRALVGEPGDVVAADPTPLEPEDPNAPLCMRDGTCGRPEGCFVAGTLVETDQGPMPIEQIAVGARVLARAASEEPLSYERVTAIKVHAAASIVRLAVRKRGGDEVLWATPNHPFHLESGRWVPVEAVAPGIDSLTDAAGDPVTVLSAESRSFDGLVYNLEVDRAHTYFVGAGHLWVHNDGCSSQTEFTCRDPKQLLGASALSASQCVDDKKNPPTQKVDGTTVVVTYNTKSKDCNLAQAKVAPNGDVTYCVKSFSDSKLCNGNKQKAKVAQEAIDNAGERCDAKGFEVTYHPMTTSDGETTSNVDLSPFALPNSEVLIPATFAPGTRDCGNDKIDFANSYQAMANQTGKTVDELKNTYDSNYTWHHDDAVKIGDKYYYKMILVPTCIHNTAKHAGGSSWLRGLPVDGGQTGTVDPTYHPPTDPGEPVLTPNAQVPDGCNGKKRKGSDEGE